jgi:hypothetical protein
MSVMTVFFEGVMALLMLALIIYCVKLNRGLAGVRGQDEQIKQMISELNIAADRAEASVSRLKAAGIHAEAAVRAAIQDAERLRNGVAARDQLTSTSNAGIDAASGVKADAAAEEALFAPGKDFPRPAQSMVRGQNREEAETAVLTAIRAARGDS